MSRTVSYPKDSAAATAAGDKYAVALNREEWLAKLENIPIKRSDMNKLIMNYLVSEGFKEAAVKFQEESGIEPAVNLESMDNRIKIRNAVLNGNVEEAIKDVNKLYPELFDGNRRLCFSVQQLNLIELIRNGKVEDALKFAQSRLSEVGESDPELLNQLERTMALLAFEDPVKCPFGDLMNQSHRIKVANELNTAILEMEHVEMPVPKLFSLMKLIVWTQEGLENKKVKYPCMKDLCNGTLEPSGSDSDRTLF